MDVSSSIAVHFSQSFLRCLSVAGRRVDASQSSVYVFLEFFSNQVSRTSSPDVVQIREMQLLRSLALKCDLVCPTANRTGFEGQHFVMGLFYGYELLIAQGSDGRHCK